MQSDEIVRVSIRHFSMNKWLCFVAVGTGCAAAYAASGSSDPSAEFGKSYSVLFNDMDLVKKGEFGMSRLPMYHARVAGGGRRQDNPNQVNLMNLRHSALSQGWLVAEGFMSAHHGKAAHDRTELVWITGVPADMVNGAAVNPKIINDPDLTNRIHKFMSKANTDTFRIKADGFNVFAQRIRYEHPECISCHSGANVGDTAGVSVIATRRK
jgi:hypothetical protein